MLRGTFQLNKLSNVLLQNQYKNKIISNSFTSFALKSNGSINNNALRIHNNNKFPVVSENFIFNNNNNNFNKISSRFNSTKKDDNKEISNNNIDENTENAENAETKKKQIVYMDPDDYDDYEPEPETRAEWVKYGFVTFARLSFLVAGLVCVYFTATELFPGRMGSNSVFSEVFEILRIKDDIISITGDNPKAFGRDHGGRNEGRRNHVDSRTFKERDGSNRTRIRFNIKGRKGQVMVWAEVSDKMSANEYVFIIVQDMRTGRVVTIEDERGRLEADMDNNISGSALSNGGLDALKELAGFGKK
jgi:hypothetical protein